MQSQSTDGQRTNPLLALYNDMLSSDVVSLKGTYASDGTCCQLSTGYLLIAMITQRPTLSPLLGVTAPLRHTHTQYLVFEPVSDPQRYAYWSSEPHWSN